MGWIGFWIKAYSKFIFYHVGIYISLLGILVIIFIKDNLFYARTAKYIFSFLIVWMPSLLFWFFTAPDVRFLGILFLMPIFIMLAILSAYFIDIKRVNTSTESLFIVVIAVNFLFFYMVSYNVSSIVRLALSVSFLFFLYQHMYRKICILNNGICRFFVLTAFGLLIVAGAVEYKKIFSLNRPIPYTDNSFVKENYYGVDIYIGEWTEKAYCSYTSLFPVSYYKNYIFIDTKALHKGFLPKYNN
ncbi:hypothetical protein C6366_10670 [Desulfonatronum sp. SC1]|nr:hypothetical protein C6366_10670 [Desulfonatronum sp. SC1]